MPKREFDTPQQLREEIGREVAVTDWIEVAQDRIDRFAEATGDHQWIHTDVKRASAESPYGATIAHGFLTLSLMSSLMAQAVGFRGGIRMGINYGLNRVRFPAAVRSGSRIRARVTLAALEEITGGLQAVWSVTIEGEGGDKPVCAAEWLVRYYE
ncbi:MAG: MaoC family dehydratase [Acidobacteria bacterium]|nr:MaoC family dehydratase [Acidobacteriota bacterium]MCW5971238.1 MaoC family dehydratase [Blastocatellales bacterium]